MNTTEHRLAGSIALNRYLLLVVCVLVLGSGCSRRSPPVAARTTAPASKSTAVTTAPVSEETANMAQMLHTRSAPELGQQLLQTKNHVVRQQAALALADMGEKGYPHLAAAMQSNSDEQRIAAIQVIDKPTLLSHQAEMVPLFTKMLRDGEPMIRRSAAARLCWFGKAAQESLRELRAMAANPLELTDIREVARVSIDLIEHATEAPNRGVDPAKMNPQPKQ